MKKRVSLLLLFAAAGAFALAGRSNLRLLDLRRRCHLNQADPLENAPPLVAFTTVALGGFRGVLADLLWMRASTLQDEGKYFELVQLADWITKLEPRLPQVWAYQAWNMAYNVSVMLKDPADRWRWVRHGISLLRDEGLRYNPGNAQLYRELAWIFFHKIGMDLDQAHRYYKRAWATEMTEAFGGAEPDFNALLAAPSDRDALFQRPGGRALWDALSAAGVDPGDVRLLDAANRPPAVADALSASPAARAYLDGLRVRALRTKYRMDPRVMKEVDERNGPLDWRLPQAHAIYWASLGLPYARSAFERLSLERTIFQSMADAFLRGRLLWQPGQRVFALLPNLDLLGRVQEAYRSALRENPGDPSVRTAYTNFLTDAIMLTYCYNHRRQAADLYDQLAKLAPDETGKEGLEVFVAATYTRYIRDMSSGEAMAVVESALYQSLFWRALGEADQAEGYNQLAQLLWHRFMDRRKDDGELRARTGLPPIEEIRARALQRVREALSNAPPAGVIEPGPEPRPGP